MRDGAAAVRDASFAKQMLGVGSHLRSWQQWEPLHNGASGSVADGRVLLLRGLPPGPGRCGEATLHLDALGEVSSEVPGVEDDPAARGITLLLPMPSQLPYTANYTRTPVFGSRPYPMP